MEATDESSASFHDERIDAGLFGAECLPSDTTCRQRKWSHAENIELMHYFYLAKSDGVDYWNRLKDIWDTRNQSKTAISVNMLCCHARNIHHLTYFQNLNYPTLQRRVPIKHSVLVVMSHICQILKEMTVLLSPQPIPLPEEGGHALSAT